MLGFPLVVAFNVYQHSGAVRLTSVVKFSVKSPKLAQPVLNVNGPVQGLKLPLPQLVCK